jgi:hypothetical protein
MDGIIYILRLCNIFSQFSHHSLISFFYAKMFVLSTRSLSTRFVYSAIATNSLKLTQRKFSENRALYQTSLTTSIKEVSNVIKRKFEDAKTARIAVSLNSNA